MISLVHDEIYDTLKLNSARYRLYDHAFMRKFIYGKTVEECRLMGPDDESQESSFECVRHPAM